MHARELMLDSEYVWRVVARAREFVCWNAAGLVYCSNSGTKLSVIHRPTFVHTPLIAMDKIHAVKVTIKAITYTFLVKEDGMGKRHIEVC